MQKGSSESKKRQIERFKQLVATGALERAGDRDFNNDVDRIRKRFTSPERDFYDELLGPLVVGPTRVAGGVHQSWRHFPIAYGQGVTTQASASAVEQFERKRRIGNLLVNLRHPNNGPFLLLRGANSLYGPGSSVFHVALALARKLRQSIEEDNSEAFGGEPFVGQIHTDMFDVARLLAPLCVRAFSPHVYFVGSLVSRLEPIVEDEPFKASERPTGAIHTLIVGVSDIDKEGRLYSKSQTHGSSIERYLQEPTDQIIIVATRDKLGRQPGGIPIRFEKRDRTVYVVTDEKPCFKQLPPGIDEVFWPNESGSESEARVFGNRRGSDGGAS